MKILVINSGSSSIKFQLFDMKNQTVALKGLIERIGLKDSIISWTSQDKDKIKEAIEVNNHQQGLKKVLDILVDENHGVIKNLNEIKAVGHRYVHGGEQYKSSTFVTDEVMENLEKLNPLAPLHNPHNLTGVKAIKELMPNTPNVLVFDTSFHSEMPEHAYIYPLPYELYKEKGIRRYGFHGTSHKYVAKEAAKAMGKDFNNSKIITCHMGNGTSYSAVKNGKSIDTTLGFSTMCGMPMGTRAGTFDPGIILHLLQNNEYTVDQLHEMIYKKSGLLGISGISSDARDVENAAYKDHNHRAQLALDLIHYIGKKYIGSYTAVMNGVDALVFTAGIGENGPETRKAICSDLEYLGIKIDLEKNKKRGQFQEISTPDSKVKVYVIPTNEELMIAEETLKTIPNSPNSGNKIA